MESLSQMKEHFLRQRFFCTGAYFVLKSVSNGAAWTCQVYSEAEAQHWKAGNWALADTYHMYISKHIIFFSRSKNMNIVKNTINKLQFVKQQSISLKITVILILRYSRRGFNIRQICCALHHFLSRWYWVSQIGVKSLNMKNVEIRNMVFLSIIYIFFTIVTALKFLR